MRSHYSHFGAFWDMLTGEWPGAPTTLPPDPWKLENHKPLISELLRISESPVRADRSVSPSEYDSCSGELKRVHLISKSTNKIRKLQTLDFWTFEDFRVSGPCGSIRLVFRIWLLLGRAQMNAPEVKYATRVQKHWRDIFSNISSEQVLRMSQVITPKPM